MKIKAAYFVASPLFVSSAVQFDPDGEPCNEDAGTFTTYNLQVVAETEDGRKFTHFKTYVRGHAGAASKFVNEVEARGAIDPQYWTEGTSWDQYAEEQTYEEEKAEHIFNYGSN